MHTFTVPAAAAGTNASHCASVPNARTVGATSAAAVSISGASWNAASKLSTACQLRGRPPPPYSVGRLTPSRPASPARRNRARSNSASQPVRSVRSRCPAVWPPAISRRRNTRTVSRNAARSGASRRSGSHTSARSRTHSLSRHVRRSGIVPRTARRRSAYSMNRARSRRFPERRGRRGAGRHDRGPRRRRGGHVERPCAPELAQRPDDRGTGRRVRRPRRGARRPRGGRDRHAARLLRGRPPARPRRRRPPAPARDLRRLRAHRRVPVADGGRGERARGRRGDQRRARLRRGPGLAQRPVRLPLARRRDPSRRSLLLAARAGRGLPPGGRVDPARRVAERAGSRRRRPRVAMPLRPGPAGRGPGRRRQARVPAARAAAAHPRDPPGLRRSSTTSRMPSNASAPSRTGPWNSPSSGRRSPRSWSASPAGPSEGKGRR